MGVIENSIQISSMNERTDFSSPLDEMIADKFRASEMFFKHLDSPSEKKESYFPLPKRFSDKLKYLPTHLRVNVDDCMRRIYREGLDWCKEASFKYLKEHTNSYPYEASILTNIYSLKELYESYWLRDMVYVSELKKTNLEFGIRLTFDTDKRAEDNHSIRLISDVNCLVTVDGHIEYKIINATKNVI